MNPFFKALASILIFCSLAEPRLCADDKKAAAAPGPIPSVETLGVKFPATSPKEDSKKLTLGEDGQVVLDPQDSATPMTNTSMRRHISNLLFPDGIPPELEERMKRHPNALCWDDFQTPLDRNVWTVKGATWKTQAGELVGYNADPVTNSPEVSAAFVAKDLKMRFRCAPGKHGNLSLYLKGDDTFGNQIRFVRISFLEDQIVIRQDGSTKSKAHPDVVKPWFGKELKAENGVFRTRKTLATIQSGTRYGWSDVELSFSGNQFSLMWNGKVVYTSEELPAFGVLKQGIVFTAVKGKVKVDDLFVE